MGEVTLKVPAEYAEEIRLAAVAEVRSDGEWVASTADELSGECITGKERTKGRLADVHGSATCLGEVIGILDQLFDSSGPYELRGEASALAHIAQTAAGKVIAPRIASETNTSPLDSKAAEKIETLTRALDWAAGKSAWLHELASAEIKAAKAAV